MKVKIGIKIIKSVQNTELLVAECYDERNVLGGRRSAA